MEIIIETDPSEQASLERRERYRFEAKVMSDFRIRIELIEMVKESRLVPATKRKKWKIDYHWTHERFGHPVKPRPGVPNNIVERAKDQIYKNTYFASTIYD
jgi:hypothetical protein